MKRYYVNLKPFMNQRHVYPHETKFDNMRPYYVEERFQFGEVEKNGVVVRIERNEVKHDNVICENQVIEIPSVLCNRIIFAGMCCWGYYKERFGLEFDDGTKDSAQTSYYDWYLSAESEIAGSMELELTEWKTYTNILAEYDKRNKDEDDRNNKCFLYYSITDLAIKGRRLKSITFPDNMFMNIFGITLEG